MKPAITLSLIYWIAFPNAFSQTQDINPELVAEEIQSGVFFVTHTFRWPANSLLVHVADGQFVLVDTPWTDAATEDLVSWLRKKYDQVHLTVINTHFHRDNLGGNAYCMKQGFPVYGSDLTVKLLQQRGEDVKKRVLKSMDAPQFASHRKIILEERLVPPDHVFPLQEGITVTVSGERIVLFFPGAAHTPDNIVVYFPKRHILFGGCMIRSLASNRIGKHSDGNLDTWPQSVKTVLEEFPDAQIVIPGHGAWGDMALVHHTIELLSHHAAEPTAE